MTNTTHTTLGRQCPNDSVPVRLKEAVEREIVKAQRGAVDDRVAGPRHLSALCSFSDWLGDRGPDQTDPRTYAIWVLAGALRNVDDYTPTHRQSELLARLASTPATVPPPDVTFTEFVVSGIEDVIEFLQKEKAAVGHERDAAIAEAARNAADAANLAAARAELREATETIDGLRGELQEARGESIALRQRASDAGRESRETQQLIANGGAGPDDAPSEKAPRRKVIEGEKGLYNTPSGALQIGWQDANGKQRWKTLEHHDLAAARELRDELSGKPFEPEAVPA